MPGTYQVLTTPAFEREFRKLVRKNPEIRKYLEQAVETLETERWTPEFGQVVKV